MKKLAIMAILATAALAASATEVAVSGSRDSTQNGVSGYSLSVAQPVAAVKGLTVKGLFETSLGVKGTNVDKYEAGAAYDVATVGPVTLTALANVGYADSQALAARGTYVSFGGKASTAVPFVKDLTASLAVTRQLGTSAVTALDHTEATIGVSYAVTKAIAVSATETVYDGIGGNKAAVGVSYSF